MTIKQELAVIAVAGIGIALLAARAKAVPTTVLPVQSSCSLPTTIPTGQNGTATVTVLAGNVTKNTVFSIQKTGGAECSRTQTFEIPGDSAIHTYTITIPASECLSNVSGTSANISIQMIFV